MRAQITGHLGSLYSGTVISVKVEAPPFLSPLSTEACIKLKNKNLTLHSKSDVHSLFNNLEFLWHGFQINFFFKSIFGVLSK